MNILVDTSVWVHHFRHGEPALPDPLQAGLHEVMAFVEREALHGLGCGLIGMTLPASTLVTSGARLWTRDRRLAKLAERFGIAHRSATH